MSCFPAELLDRPLFAMPHDVRKAALLPALQALTAHHKAACPAYRKMVDLAFPGHENANDLAGIPYLPVSLFKNRTLSSVPKQDIRVTIKSSGTTGTARSQIHMDRATTQLSSQTLAAIFHELVGAKRLPLLIVDTQSALAPSMDMGARAAAILGLMPFGYDTTFLLDNDLHVDEMALRTFLARHGSAPFLIYGFTFLIWQTLVPVAQKLGLDLSNATLMHSGGWKYLAAESVDNKRFRQTVRDAARITRVINYYGMAEMPGVVFAENADGFLYPPSFADVLIRDPLTLAPLPDGQTGLVQILSAVPHSFPGHALLTEDLGRIVTIDSGSQGWHGKAVEIIGRVPKAELRGCSDVIAQSQQG